MTDSEGRPAWLSAYEGLGVDEIRQLAAREGRPVRVVGPHEAVTLEYVENRVNVRTDESGAVLGVSAG